MKIIPVSDGMFPLIQQFILPYEHSCVLLASYIRKKDENLAVIVADTDLQNLEDIVGVLYFNRVLLHCIPSLMIQLRPLILEFLDGKNLKCLNGEKAGSDFILEALNSVGIQPFHTNKYYLMTLDQSAIEAPEELSCDDELRRCYDSDFEALFELQKKYLAKEVAPAGKVVTDSECSISLRQILKNQLCFAIFADGEAVSKANTNAIGFNWVQLGGVYTHPLYRKNYYAWHLVCTVCGRVQKTGRKICLFVKEKNNPAQLLYKRMGFIEKNGFEICYF